jgi:acetyl-CoA carboxylase carboxyltransferase component
VKRGFRSFVKRGKMTARERIDYLLDKDSDSIEIGAFAGYEMYEEHGGCPSGVLLW